MSQSLRRGWISALGVAVLFGLWAIACALACFPLAIFLRGRGIPSVGRVWGRGALFLAGARLVIESETAIARDAVMTVMANHTSHYDVLALYAGIPFGVRMVAKRELVMIPIFGWVLGLGAAILVDRKSRTSAIASMELAGRVIARGRSVLLFPEGTRTPPGVIGPMKKGPFYLAASARVPILPVIVCGSHEVLTKGDWRIRPGTITVRMGRPIDTQSVPNDEAGRAALMSEVQAAWVRLGQGALEPQNEKALDATHKTMNNKDHEDA